VIVYKRVYLLSSRNRGVSHRFGGNQAGLGNGERKVEIQLDKGTNRIMGAVAVLDAWLSTVLIGDGQVLPMHLDWYTREDK
jgi:hypothetical protein